MDHLQCLRAGLYKATCLHFHQEFSDPHKFLDSLLNCLALPFLIIVITLS